MAADPRGLVPVPRRGRPRLASSSSSVSTWVPTRYHDRLVALATEHRTSVSQLVKDMIILHLHRK